MSSAIIGFVGVIIGAIIVAGSDYLMASRRERADTQREIAATETSRSSEHHA